MDQEIAEDSLQKAQRQGKLSPRQAQTAEYLESQQPQGGNQGMPLIPNSSESNSLPSANVSLTGEPQDVTNAAQYLGGGQNFSGWCEKFAEGVAGEGPQGDTAADAFQNQLQEGKAVADPSLSGAKAGDLVYFNPDSSNENDGHVGVLTDNGKTFISATYNGVQAYNLNDWEKSTGQSISGFVPIQ